jgi:hypothetical protein
MYRRRAEPPLVSDRTGGAYLGWDGASFAARVLRLDSTGQIALGWPTEGVCIDADCSLTAFLGPIVEDGNAMWMNGGVPLTEGVADHAALTAVADGTGGAIVAWLTDVDPGSGYTVEARAQRVAGNGVRQWPVEGVLLSGGVDISGGVAGGYGGLRLLQDGAGGAIAVWTDWRTYATTGIDLYAQRITAAGALAAGWSASSQPVCVAPGDQANPQFPGELSLAADGDGGAYLAWQDQRAGWQVYATRVLGNGAIAPGWMVDGTRVPPEEQNGSGYPLVVPSAPGVIVVWGFGGDVDAAKLIDGMLVAVDAIPGDASPAGIVVRLASPNPSSRTVRFDVHVPKAMEMRADIVDVRGRRVRTVSSETMDAGSHPVVWDELTESGSPVRGGMYILRLEGAGMIATRACLILR